ncbi:hypothetical protein AC1031_018900 [Aphanomyces cochlioides]|nr:hypothetical protein AC1031_018900 [Aphanomyces cochlioides]
MLTCSFFAIATTMLLAIRAENTPLTAVSPAIVQVEHEGQEPPHHYVPFNRYLQENYDAAGYTPPHHECGGGGYGGYGGGFGGYNGGYGGFGGGYEDFEGHGY